MYKTPFEAFAEKMMQEIGWPFAVTRIPFSIRGYHEPVFDTENLSPAGKLYVALHGDEQKLIKPVKIEEGMRLEFRDVYGCHLMTRQTYPIFTEDGEIGVSYALSFNGEDADYDAAYEKLVKSLRGRKVHEYESVLREWLSNIGCNVILEDMKIENRRGKEILKLDFDIEEYTPDARKLSGRMGMGLGEENDEAIRRELIEGKNGIDFDLTEDEFKARFREALNYFGI